MRTSAGSWGGRSVLMLAHIAGMIDLVALPVWVGTTLIGQYRFTPPQAGAMVTIYLVAVVVASLLMGPRFHLHRPHRAAPAGFAVASCAFIALTQVSGWAPMAALHAIAGFGAGLGLSFTHGTIGRSGAPHRLFAIVSTGLGISAIVFLGIAQSLIPRQGGATLFEMFAALMLLAGASTALAFPRLDSPSHESRAHSAHGSVQPIEMGAWWVIGGITLMSVCQAMLFSFVERIGFERGFGARVVEVLVAMGFVNLVPPVLAALLEKRFEALRVAMCGAVLQALLAGGVAFSRGFPVYALSVAVFISVIVFTHTFVFGWLSRHDRTGRAVALTPAMLMTGAAVGPVGAGVLVAGFGTTSLGIAALLLDATALACYFRASRSLPNPMPGFVPLDH